MFILALCLNNIIIWVDECKAAGLFIIPKGGLTRVVIILPVHVLGILLLLCKFLDHQLVYDAPPVTGVLLPSFVANDIQCLFVVSSSSAEA